MTSVADPNPRHYRTADQVPQQSKKSYPNPHQCQKSDPDPHQSKTTGAVEAHNEAMKAYHPRAVGDQNGAEEAHSRAVRRLWAIGCKFTEI